MLGKPVPRKDGLAKITGQARYAGDVTLPGMLHGVTVRSPVPRGRIRAIRYAPEIDWHEFTLVTAQDIPGCNVIELIACDQPCLAETAVNHAEEPVLLIAHPDLGMAGKARQSVQVDIEPWPAVLSIEEALEARHVVWGEDNVLKRITLEQGEVDRAWDEAASIWEGHYQTAAQEQLYLEPNGMLAVASPEEGVTVWGSLQCPYYVHRALCRLFGLPEHKVRVVQLETGGGFGGKEDYPSMIAGHAALLAWKSGRPVRLIYDRAEDMAATTKRHPARIRHRTAVSREGKLLAMDIELLLDGGAYTTVSPVVLSRAVIHAAGVYACPNVRVRGAALATNHPPNGAFRGFGAPQSLFALECHMDEVARGVGLDPDEFRRRNFLQPGDAMATGQIVREPIDLPALLQRALELSGYHQKRARFALDNPTRMVKKGIGLACFLHGAGFTGSGERHLQSVAAVEATGEGGLRVLASSAEIGQGARTVLAQIAAQTLGLPGDWVEVPPPDTAEAPDSGPTVASRTSMIVGKLVQEAALALRQILAGAGYLDQADGPERFRAACARYTREMGPLRASSSYSPPPGVHWDDAAFRGDAYGAFSWAVYVAEVSVDLATYEVRVDDFVALQEVGHVLNPLLAEGQIQGGVAQAIGWTLSENVAWSNGRMANHRMTDYLIPTAGDLPPLRVYFEEKPYPHGPYGAKGLGELPTDGPAPAILNAVSSALGIRFRQVPLLPEHLEEALNG
ncbi:MAG: xanthine dehydrogenase family protein [Acidobacteria bacterium]|nr:xanthine dehydrogenase family protein [Acidobacteriota bacterium]